MTRHVSPERFARAQQLGRAMPLLVLAAVIVIGWLVVDRGRSTGASGVLSSVGSFVFYILATGGIALGYLGWWLSMTSKGILSTPRVPWRLDFADDAIHIETVRRSTRVPVSTITSATLICDDNWDRLKGLEDQCLALDLKSGARLLLPGSSAGFEEVRLGVARKLDVVTKLVE